MNKNIDVTLEELQNGAIGEKFNQALEEVIKNIVDQNTDHKVKRKIQIALTMTPNEQRNMMSTKVDVKTTLAPPRPLESIIAIGTDGTNVGASEVGNQIVGQQYVDLETGEIKDGR